MRQRGRRADSLLLKTDSNLKRNFPTTKVLNDCIDRWNTNAPVHSGNTIGYRYCCCYNEIKPIKQ